jgi:hypothetical protein
VAAAPHRQRRRGRDGSGGQRDPSSLIVISTSPSAVKSHGSALPFPWQDASGQSPHAVQPVHHAFDGRQVHVLPREHGVLAGHRHVVEGVAGVLHYPPLPVSPLVYWDEVDRAPVTLRRWALRAAGRRGATVVAGTHVDPWPARPRRPGLP